MFRNFNCHVVAGNDGHHTRIMAQYLKGVFNWEMESLHDLCQKIEFSGLPDQADTGRGAALGQYQNSVTEKKSQLEGYLRKRISSLRSEEVIRITFELEQFYETVF